jgi:hypothetical protein
VVTKRQKFRLIREALILYVQENKLVRPVYDKGKLIGFTKPKINRQKLRLLIKKALGVTNRLTVYDWIDNILTRNYIDFNHTSQLSRKEKLIMPTNDTRYFINICDLVDFRALERMQKRNLRNKKYTHSK